MDWVVDAIVAVKIEGDGGSVVSSWEAEELDGGGTSCADDAKLEVLGGGRTSCDDDAMMELVGMSVFGVWVETMIRSVEGGGSSFVEVSSPSSISDKSYAISSSVGSVTSIVVAVPSDPEEDSTSSKSSPVCWSTGGSGILQ